MEYDSASSCEGPLRDLEITQDPALLRQTQPIEHRACMSNSSPWHSLQLIPARSKSKGIAGKSLSTQVMEYYQKYSQNSNLDQYFSLPTSDTTPEAIKYYCSVYELNSTSEIGRQNCIGEEYNIRNYVPRERRRWVRPPLIGQSCNTEVTSRYVQPLMDPHSPSPDVKRITPDTIPEEKNESQELLPEGTERKVSSPTSSIASHKRLEWDSGADVGYFNTLPHNKQNCKKLSTIERIALATGCSAALRLDPEGTTESGVSGKLSIAQRNSKCLMIPNANSTPLVRNASGSESEIEITPIVKNHLPGIITGNDIKSEEKCIMRDVKRQESMAQSLKRDQTNDTPKSSFMFKIPVIKYPTEGRKVTNKQVTNKENLSPLASPLKKSMSMNTLIMTSAKLPLKRSQSELNLYAKDKNKGILPLIFNSTSSIATVVNKPATCDKFIQTSMDACTQESIGVQVSVLDEEKPPLPKRGASLQKTLQPILKNERGTYKIQNIKRSDANCKKYNASIGESMKKNKAHRSSSDYSQNGSTSQTPPNPDETENVTGRANSFEYFPGHIYENVPNGSGSHVSSSDTIRSNSTLPNTSSSINEKLWGDSDSLVRDLERSVNILKSLVDANKCDKEVKKRLIHHVVKRLITAKYMDDKIEHNLEDNVPWNPDDARNKVYRTNILQALAKKHSTTESSDGWNAPKTADCQRKSIATGRELMKDETLESSNSDKFDKHTDRAEMDGRKARMGLRVDDCTRNNNIDGKKSGSSECFFPQRGQKNGKVRDLFCMKKKCKMPHGDTTTTNSTPPDHNRMLLDAVVNNRRTPTESSNNMEDNINWRLPTTLSERQFELKKCNSDSCESKLVSYAEMEKRNQLIWITNEISHLCNLKKLLEQPRKMERQRVTPRKFKSVNVKTKPAPGLAQRNASIVQENSTEDPWSSHCNLATCQPTSTSSSVIEHIKKRNSCAQTATNVVNAHSRTGGEIVSASNIRSSTIQLINAGVQTLEQESPATPAVMQSEVVHYVKCPVHNALMHFQNNCTCNDQICQCQKVAMKSMLARCTHCVQEQNQSRTTINRSQKQHTDSSYDTESQPLIPQAGQLNPVNGSSTNLLEIHVPANKDSNQCKQKEAKNQINTTKSKCICECKAAHTCQCIADYKHKANDIGDEEDKYKRLLSKISQLCSTQISTTEVSATCRAKNSEDKVYSRGHSIKPNYVEESSANDSNGSCKYCRRCGIIYQNTRKCGCHQTYPKSVAYELSFTKDRGHKSDKVDLLQRVPLSNLPQNESKSDGCACDIMKDGSSSKICQKNTLQDYLSRNKPEFIDNVETRQQYMSEISHLRHLRKEKRVQLLAMATAPSLIKSPKLVKPTACLQKKITDAEMKERLRRRYLRLNEVRFKRRQQERQEEARRNKLMAKIFCKKLQQKVLRGQVDLSQSVSVISNL
ncbi:hypothetical protein KM043_007151 [Ampulex compressa]|nr:hypothetical protein KM043_007151 [Ampulex compressa]